MINKSMAHPLSHLSARTAIFLGTCGSWPEAIKEQLTPNGDGRRAGLIRMVVRFFSSRGDGENSICCVQTIADYQTIEGKELLELVPTTHEKAQSDCLARNTLRKYLLLTLNHAERENRSLVTAADIIDRLNSVFNCKAIIISKELHRVQGHHLHIGVWNENASKNTLNQRIRELFPEFEGRQCNVSAHRIWDTVCQYILKQDNTPVVWGEESLEEIKNRLDAKQNKKKNKLIYVPKFQFSVPKVRFSKGRANNVEVLRRLYEKSEWIQVLKDELLGPRCVTNYNNLRQIFIDVRLDLVKNSKYLDYFPNFIKLFLLKNLRAIYSNQFGFFWFISFFFAIAFPQMNFFLLKQFFEIYLNQWFTSATQWFTSATFLHEFFIHFEKEFAANFEIDKEIIAIFEDKLAANNIIPETETETNSFWTTPVITIGIGLFCYIIYVLSSQN